VFNVNEVTDQQLDWTILRDGGVALYCRPEVLATDLKWLETNAYRIVEFDAAGWDSEEEMHDSFKSRLSFPDYYGNNLDALNECMWDDLVVPDTGGLVLVFQHYDHFAKAIQNNTADGRRFADIVLHVLARAIRYHMLFGRRLIIIVQSDDPRIAIENLAPVYADWNPREWLAKKRGL
jgi:RNAse (barnase) inhibitor barstar